MSNKYSPLTYYNENSCQVAGFLGGGGAGPDRGEGGLSHPRVDPQVHVGKVGEWNDARTEESRPVDVVIHVVWVHTKHKYQPSGDSAMTSSCSSSCSYYLKMSSNAQI